MAFLVTRFMMGAMIGGASDPSLLALAAVEDAIDRYVAERRARIDPFVKRHFSLVDTFALQRRSLLPNLLCYPVNSLWSIPYLFIKKVGESLDKLGWLSAGHVVAAVPSGVKSLYQRQVERMVLQELVGSEEEFMELLRTDPRAAAVFTKFDTVEHVTSAFADVNRLVETYGSGRALVADTAGSLVAIAVGWWVFGDHSLGVSGMGERIAQKRAHDKAASSFVLGAGLGSAFYSIFPPKPTTAEVVLATTGIALLLTLCGVAIGVLNDPLLKRLGLHHRQLHALVDSVEDRLYLLRKRLKQTLPRESSLA